MTPTTSTPDARSDWEARISLRSDPNRRAPLPDLDPPTGLVAESGVAQVTLRWDSVPGAVGYLLHRAPSADGPWEVVDHHGQDVLSVPHPPYVDTTGEPGAPCFYAVSAIPEVTKTDGRRSEPVPATPLPAGSAAPVVDVTVDAGAAGTALPTPWRPMIGSERLSQLLCQDRSGGRVIGDELRTALGRMHDEIGVRAVRAHAIFHADTGVYREVDGEPVHDFSVVDRIYDTVLELGLVPTVEVGFMPDDLASTDDTVFEYGARISPPKDWDRWADLVGALTRHLVERYGREEVVTWDFEIWNEANLEVFWSGTQQEWMHLYDVSVRAIKAVDERIPVGGPSSAAAGWVDDLLAHCRESGSPVDFVTTHTYGSPPLDVRASLERHGFGDARILWTEWGVTPTHFNPVNDSVFSGVFLVHGMRSAAGRVEALSYWVASDHFEELGRPPRLLHGGFGLQSVGGLAKPRFHAMSMLAALGPTELPLAFAGDGAGSLVDGWASRHDDGSLTVLLWDLTLDQHKADGDDALRRDVRLALTGLEDGEWQVEHTALAEGVADLRAAAADLGVGDWPTDEQWADLADRSALSPATTTTTAADGTLTVPLGLTMPSAHLLRLRRRTD